MNIQRIRALLLLTVFVATILLTAMAGMSPGVKPQGSLASGGLDGSNSAGMRAVQLPARVSRVAMVPGTAAGEAWAIGYMTHGDPSWPTDQTVMLHYTRSSGWKLDAPAKDANGNSLGLNSLSFAANGEGWAVGTSGAMGHYVPGSGWSFTSACDPVGPISDSACPTLYGVSLTPSGVGYAVGLPHQNGSANTILRYDGSRWSLDPSLVAANPNAIINLYAVSAVGADDAWAVGGTSGRELQVFRRRGVIWERQKTGNPIFDNPGPSNDQATVNLSAAGWSVAASSDGSTVWVGGGLYPIDPGRPLEQADTPFTLRCDVSNGCGGASDANNTSGWTSFCPPQYSLYDDNANRIDVCNKRMPLSPYDVDSLSLLPNGEVFGGGFGLFHFKAGAWFREPNSNSYLSSVAFALGPDGSPEGWVASSMPQVGGGGGAASGTSTLGHYSASPPDPRTARWPNFNTSTLYGVATSPSGTDAVAVGNNGSVLLYRQVGGWDRLPGAAGDARLQGVAWLDAKRAYGVGSRGALAEITRGGVELLPTNLTTNDLNSVAFSGGRGFAVGDRGTMLSFSGGSWRADPQNGSFGVHLYDIAPYGNGFVAVGGRSTLLVNPSGSPGDWRVDDSVIQYLGTFNDPGRRPDLFAVDVSPQGSIVVGGNERLLLVSEGSGFRSLTPLDSTGSILDLKVRRTNGTLQVVALFSEAELRFKARRTTMMLFDGSRWIDLESSGVRTMHSAVTGNGTNIDPADTDVAGIPDPAFSLSMDSANSAWAVGGIVPNVGDEYQNYYVDQTSTVYRMDLTGDPRPRSTQATVSPAQQGLNFAYFSESSCGKGYCSTAVGSGTQADKVALKIRDEINAATRLPNPPRFVIFGGDMRAQGIPDELAQFKGYLSEFQIPVFAAIGPNDVFSSGAGGQARGFLPPVPDDDLERAGLKPPDLNSATGSNRFYKENLGDQWFPWGNNRDSERFGIRAVDIGLPATDGLARTHYAFDYAIGERRIARFVILDTSDHLFSKQAQSSKQNPPNQDQASWLSLVVSDAKSNYDPPLPVIVSMNVPTVNPLKNLSQRTLADGASFEAAAVGYGLSAVLTGYVRANATYAIPNAATPGNVPVYVLGGGGAPPVGSDVSRHPNDGYYHSWALVNVDTRGVSLLQPQAKVSVAPIPVVESVFLHPVEGLSAEGGWTLQFQAMARALSGGAQPNDPRAKKMTYLKFPTSPHCLTEGSSGGYCLNLSALKPHYRFVSENPDVADFVLPSGLPRYPAVIGGFLIPDDQLGFLCTFKAGTAWVKIIAGSQQMRLPVTVGAGFGPCVDHPILIKDPPIPGRAEPPSPIEQPAPKTRPLFHVPPFPENLVAVLPPVPAPIAAPAPPASAASSRKEEEEHQTQAEGQEGDGNEARVLSYQRRSSHYDPVLGWVTVAGASMLGLLLAATAAAVLENKRRKRAQPAYVEWRN